VTTFDPLAPPPAHLQKKWYKAGNKAHEILVPFIKAVKDEQEYVFARFRRSIELYDNVDCPDLESYRYSTDKDSGPPYGYNVVEATADTLHAEILSNRTKAQAVTTQGDWELKERAEDQTDFLVGVMHEVRLQEKVRPAVLRDAIAHGTGIYRDCERYYDGRVGVERVYPWEVIVDESSITASNEPREIYHEYIIPRSQLLDNPALTQRARKIVESAPEATFKHGPRRRVTDLIRVSEAWRLKSTEDADDGRYVLCLENGTVFDEEYYCASDPFTVVRFKTRTKGWYGKGVAEIMDGAQDHINELREKMKINLAGSSPFIWLPEGAEITEAEITNEIWRIIKSKEPPQHMVYNAIPQDMVQRFETEKSDAPNLVGVNMAMMKSELPPGIDGASGKSQIVYNDTKSKRFFCLATDDEAAVINLSYRVLERADKIVDDGNPYKAVAIGDGWIQIIDYSNIRLEKNSFMLRLAPVNLLSDSVSARLREVETLMGIAPEPFKPYIFGLLKAPDLESITNVIDADSRAFRRIFGMVLRGKAKAGDVMPQPFMDLQLGVQMARGFYLDAMTAGCPDTRLEQMRQWIGAAQAMLAAQSQMAQPAPPPPGMEPAPPPTPQGAPMPGGAPMLEAPAPQVPMTDMGGMPV
jgi:hypothetical protein